MTGDDALTHPPPRGRAGNLKHLTIHPQNPKIDEMFSFIETQLGQVKSHALEEYPYECCGIITGKPGSSEEDILHRCKNIQNKLHAMDPKTFVRDARTAFYIDPMELMGILKETEKKQQQIKAFYHSHPDHDAYFSEEDERMALFDREPLYPGACYLVVSVYDRKIKDLALFAWNSQKKVFEKQKNINL
ncbi:MAG: Mov34/MPN/PAD-1 family protein [Nitrospinaceae bacterium]